MQYGKTIIHVELNSSYQGKKNYYFGSLIAIYDTLPTTIVGISYEDLLKEQIDGEESIVTSNAIIRKASILRHKTNRGQGRRKH